MHLHVVKNIAKYKSYVRVSVPVTCLVCCFFAQWDYRCGFISTGWCLSIEGLQWRWKSVLVWSCPFYEVRAKWQRLSVFLRDQHSRRTTWFCPERESAAEWMDNSSVRETAGEGKIKGVWVSLFYWRAFQKGTINLPAEEDQRPAKPTNPPNTPECSLYSPFDLKSFWTTSEPCC